MTRGARAALAFALVMSIVTGVYLLRMDEVAGMYVDDAWYIVLAKSLAGGHGYRLISSATAEILPAVPPGFPALLAPIVLAVPAFPDHVIWMKLLSLAAVLAAGAICWRDFVRHRGIAPAHATLIVAATLLVPALVFLVTSTVMSDCVFLLAQVAAIAATERVTRRASDDVRGPVIAGLLTAAAMLIRTAAAALIVAAIVYLLIAGRRRQAAIFSAVVLTALLPWTVYSAVHAPTADERSDHGGVIAYSYSQLLTAAELSALQQGPTSSATLLGRAATNAGVVISRDAGALFAPVLYRGADESGQELFSIGRARMGDMGITSGTMIVSSVIAAMLVFGWMVTPSERFALPGLVAAATVPMIAPVAGQTFRYLIPLAPYLMLFFWHAWRSPAAARIAFLTMLGLQGMDHAGYVQQKLTTTTEWIADFRETRETTAWIAQHVPADQAVAATNPGLIYLDSHRRAVAIDGMRRNWQRWKASGVRFVSSNVAGSELPTSALAWQLRFRTQRRRLWVVEIE